jgi:hypothetical protein
MAGVTTAMCASFKKEMLEGVHHLQGTVTTTGNPATSTTLGTLASIADISAGMLVADTTTPANIAANTYVSRFLSATSVRLDTAAGGTATGDTLTFKGDALSFALIKVGPTGTYGVANVNYSDITGNSDEIPNGSGYTTGGFVWAAGVSTTPASSTAGSGSAWTQPSTNPSWTSATISTIGGMLYNASQLNKAICVESFGGTQTVTGGTLTLLLPTNGSATSLLQVN